MISPSSMAPWLPEDALPLGVVIIDHGSIRAESNEMLSDVVKLFSQHSGHSIVESAHMELAKPSLEVAFRRCVEQGARSVVIFPYFLGPGRHVEEDIPRLAAEAARLHPDVNYCVTAPLGLHPQMAGIIAERIKECFQQLR